MEAVNFVNRALKTHLIRIEFDLPVYKFVFQYNSLYDIKREAWEHEVLPVRSIVYLFDAMKRVEEEICVIINTLQFLRFDI